MADMRAGADLRWLLIYLCLCVALGAILGQRERDAGAYIYEGEAEADQEVCGE